MRKILIAVLVLMLAASFCYAKMIPSTKAKATTPVGVVAEMGAVFVGRIVDATDDAIKGRSVSVSGQSGEIRIYPVDETVKIVDMSYNAITLKELRKGEKVKVQTKAGSEKPESISVTK